MMNPDNAISAVLIRNQFYRRQFSLAIAAFALSLLVLGVLISVLIYVVHHPEPPLYFATDNVGRLIEVVPVDRANMSDEEVTQWTVNAVQRAYTYDYVNFREQMQSAQKYFSEYGWRQFLNAFKKSKNIDGLLLNKMIFEAKIIGQPKLVTAGLLGGARAWKYEMQMLVTVLLPPYDEKSTFVNAWDVSVIVQRQSILQSSDGLGIIQLVSSAAASSQTNTSRMTSTPSG